MAEQKLNYFKRRAIWEAHGKRCAYCGEPLSFSQLEIDHILPEALLGAPERWRLIREEQSLPAGFSLLGYENLQPSCRRCNSRKRADPFLPGRIAIELGVAGRAKRQINDLIDDFKKADQRDKLRFAIAGALGSGELSERDIHDIFSSARANEGIFRLSAPFISLVTNRWERFQRVPTNNTSTKYCHSPQKCTRAFGLSLMTIERCERGRFENISKQQVAGFTRFPTLRCKWRLGCSSVLCLFSVSCKQVVLLSEVSWMTRAWA